MTEPRRIPAETSVLLDLVRVIAALMVFISHLSSHHFSDGRLWLLAPFGARAVDVFFVLSGFLIAASLAGRPFDARHYAIARLSRLYSVTVPALLFAVLVFYASAALGWGDRFYPAQTPLQVFDQVVAGLLYVALYWNLPFYPLINGAYWSLCFEATYYAAFGLLMCRWRHRRLAFALLALAAGPRVMALFPLWLLGVATQKCAATASLSPRAGRLLVAGGLVFLVWLLPHVIWHFQGFELDYALSDHRTWRAILDRYVTGLWFAAMLLGLNAMRTDLRRVLTPLRRPAAWLAGRSFAMYLFHVPLLVLTVGLLPWPKQALQTQIAALLLVPLLALLLAEISEQRKDWWVRLFERLLAPRDRA